MQREWNLHYFRFVIGDGEPERRVSDVFDWFAISFWSDAGLIRTTEKTRSATSINEDRYRVTAEVIYISHDPKQAACIVDFGIRAISSGVDIPPSGCQEGDYLTGEVLLELPLCTAVHPHNLVHRWRVNKISADLTPYVLDSSNRMYVRDTSQILYKDTPGTDSVQAESYLLHCCDLGAGFELGT
jgi:hypothetical protein